MSVDTAQKRHSLLGFGSPVPRLLPIPQGSLAADDRALLLYLYAGLTLGAVVEAATEAPSGGWRPYRRPREETETDREARVKAERIRLGIIQPDPTAASPPPNSEFRIQNSEFNDAERLASLYAQADALAEANAALELAGDLAALRIAEEIGMYFRIEEQLRLEERLRDDDEAFLMILAVAIENSEFTIRNSELGPNAVQ